jgi:hypothetical protein
VVCFSEAGVEDGAEVSLTVGITDLIGVGATVTSPGFFIKAKYTKPPANITTKTTSKIIVAEPF